MGTDIITELNRVLELPRFARVVAGNGGLPKVSITSPEATGEMYLHGAHVTSWRPAGAEEVLYVSPNSRWEDGRTIRGGVPICFPWFGDKSHDPTAPAHGFVRTKAWRLLSIEQNSEGVAVIMVTESDAGTKRLWPADFRLVHRATFGSELILELVLTNAGTTPLRFEEALHSYYRVGDVTKARLRGLDAVHYLDKTDSNHEKTQHGDIVIAEETDRVYLNTKHALDLDDPVLSRQTRITKENSLTTVVWNPWVQKVRAISDLGEGEWARMVCVETSNVSSFAVDLAPGQEHRMKATVRVRVL